MGKYNWDKGGRAEARLRALRTFKGKTYTMYACQKANSKGRGHNPPCYTLEEFREWITSHKDWITLYDNWVRSGYDRWLAPSCDRLRDDKPYTFDNIRLVMWKVNHLNGFENRKKNLRNH